MDNNPVRPRANIISKHDAVPLQHTLTGAAVLSAVAFVGGALNVLPDDTQVFACNLLVVYATLLGVVRFGGYLALKALGQYVVVAMYLSSVVGIGTLVISLFLAWVFR